MWGAGTLGVGGGVCPVWGKARVVVKGAVPFESRGVVGRVSVLVSVVEAAESEEGGPFGVGGMIGIKE